MSKIDEDKILKLLSAANPAKQRQCGFVELMRLYQRHIYWHVRRLVVIHEDAEDITQEVFINVYRYIESFKGNSSLKTWLYKISTNESLKHLKKRCIETKSYDENTMLLARFEADEDIDFNSMEAKLQQAILSLPPKQQAIFNMRYYDEMDYQQISHITGSSIATLKSNYHYAKKSITESLIKQAED